MERLTDCAQGYCEVYCKKYGHCFGDPGDCIFKEEVAMYEKLKTIEAAISVDHLRELVQAEKDGRLVVLPCKVGDSVYYLITDEPEFGGTYVSHPYKVVEAGKCGFFTSGFCDKPDEMDDFTPWTDLGKTVFLTHKEAEAALEAQKGGGGENG